MNTPRQQRSQGIGSSINSSASSNAVFSEPTAARSRQTEAERAKVKWAWSMDRAARTSSRLVEELERSAVKEDLLDVVRLLSSNTIETQTVEPSYTATLRNVKLEANGARSIAVQCGQKVTQQSSGMQVVEADIVAEAAPRHALTDALNPEEAPLLDVGHVGSFHSSYLPTCNVPADLYPVFMSDARALGISNRYGYVALPKPPVELPPRRHVKVVNPADYPHLYGSHELHIDEHTTAQLNRAHSLWASSSGFVPKY